MYATPATKPTVTENKSKIKSLKKIKKKKKYITEYIYFHNTKKTSAYVK